MASSNSGLRECSALKKKLIMHHDKQLELCNSLEEIADTLPDISNTQKVLVICRDMLPVIKTAHQFEEETVFPVLDLVKPGYDTLERNLERLRFEHWEDEGFAEEIVEVLKEFANNPVAVNADKLSYMLRGFFEGMRRHIAFETEYLLPAINRSK